MLENDYLTLKNGLTRMLDLYDSMYAIVEEENRIIKGGKELKTLIDTGNRKLELMRQIGEIDGQMSLLKQAWQREMEDSPNPSDEIAPLLDRISEKLRMLLKLDGENGRLLGSLTKKVTKKSAVQSPQRAATAYRKTAGIK